jgi:hypothetical protein
LIANFTRREDFAPIQNEKAQECKYNFLRDCKDFHRLKCKYNLLTDYTDYTDLYQDKKQFYQRPGRCVLLG